jgi:WD40 repeat protein
MFFSSSFGTVLRRQRILLATTSLVSASYHPSEAQILTLSVDGQLAYWEVIDGAEIRTATVGKHGNMTAMDISNDGESVAIAGADSVVKVNC